MDDAVDRASAAAQTEHRDAGSAREPPRRARHRRVSCDVALIDRYNQRALYGPLKVFTGRAHPSLAQEICGMLGGEPGRVSLYSFSDGENYVQIDENVRGAD